MDVNALNMASLTDMLDTLNPDPGTSPARKNAVVEETPPLPDNDDVASLPTADTCWTAMKALQDSLRQNCGMGATINIGPMAIEVPATIMRVAAGEGLVQPTTRDLKIDAVRDTNWCKEAAERLQSTLAPELGRDSPVFFRANAAVMLNIATAVVEQAGHWQPIIVPGRVGGKSEYDAVASYD